MPSTILVLGAGRSSSSLISWLLKNSAPSGFTVTVGDVSWEAAKSKVSQFGTAIEFDIHDVERSRMAIQGAHVVISVLPPHLHVLVANICLEEKKHLLTASYVSPEMKLLDGPARENNLLFLNECGLDPGLDHMSALQIIDRIKSVGGKLISFESFTGGLIAPETDPSNPWRYKFTWNPRNVVMAGQGTAKFLQQGQFKYIPYQQLFRELTQVTVPGYGDFEGYVNRDSLKYRKAYGLPGIQTMVRGTLRYKGYCSAWNILVQLGCTEDTWKMDAVGSMTHADFINSFLSYDPLRSAEEKICRRLNLDLKSPELGCLKWSGFFDEERIGLDEGTPAQVVEHILNKKWNLHPADKDLVVMWHRFIMEQDGGKKEIQSSLVAKGENSINTAMAKTVGLPLAIAAKLLLEGKIKSRGVIIPVAKEIYDPVLAELKKEGIEWKEVSF
jgi:saccharopine dehydrogenase-like NADP-dependent oxidoreductase